MNTKHCHKCDNTLPVTSFYSNKARADGIGTACKKCVRKQANEHRARHPRRVYLKELTAKVNLKLEVFAKYCDQGVRCKKCGFADERALTIDHVEGNGNQHRATIKRKGTSFYRWLKQQAYPDGFQVLCMNCQFIKRHENGEHNAHKKPTTLG